MGKQKIKHKIVETIIHRNDFVYLPEKDLPLLVVGVKARWFNADGSHNFNFTVKKPWELIPIAHQTGGHACHQHYILGQVVVPKNDNIKHGMIELSEKWLDSEAGCFGVSLNELNDYRDDLWALFQADCNRSYDDFEEGIAPIDISFLKTMTRTKFLKDLDDMLKFGKPFDSSIGCLNRWGMWILMDNCD